MLRTHIINYFIKKYNYQTYLEIGTRDVKRNFQKIKCINKECIDPFPLNKKGITYVMTSDKAFESIKQNNKKYDLIFIDGLHLENQVDRDIKNSIDCLTPNGTIILHDCNPPTVHHAGDCFETANKLVGAWNGTVYKSIVKFNKNNTCGCVIDTDWGCGIIRPILQNEPIVMDFNPLIMEWDEFEKNRTELLKLKQPSEL